VIRIKALELPKIPEGGGTISNLAFQKQDPNRCSVFLDETYAFGLHVDIVMQRDLKKGLFLSEQQCNELADEDLYFKAMKRCMDFIAYRPRSQSEIDSRLKQLGVSEEIAQRVAGRLVELNLVNDAEYARMFVESRIRSRGFGRFRIKQELIQKGIESSVADATLDKLYTAENEQSQLVKLIAAAKRKYRNETDQKVQTNKITSFLVRKGFDGHAIREQLKASE